MSEPLPIGVVLPVFNCREHLSPHLMAVREWAGWVKEIVVVDSFSDDGTLDVLKEHLPQARFTSHPRGLYQSWNFGIGQVTARYTYISTVGDVITREGLQHLAAVAEELQADAVLSPPRFVAPAGHAVKDWCWPIHHLIASQAINGPKVIEPVQAFLMTVMNLPEGILGSSASNLYRTEMLKGRPFPAEYGHAGDTVWSLRHALQTKFAVTPSATAEFLIHPKDVRLDDEERARLIERCYEFAFAACREAGAGELQRTLEVLGAEARELGDRQRRYDRRRKHPWPWILNPQAWRRRLRRNEQWTRVARLKDEICAQYGLGRKRK